MEWKDTQIRGFSLLQFFVKFCLCTALSNRAGSSPLHRLFSAFPRGWPAIGLLLLRVVAGLTLVAEGVAYIGEGSGPGLGIGLLLIVSGVALSAGFMTPVSGLLAILAELGSMLAWFPAINLHLFDVRTTVIDVIAMCAAIICIGPGAISVDARLFGRREIIIPSSRPPKL